MFRTIENLINTVTQLSYSGSSAFSRENDLFTHPRTSLDRIQPSFPRMIRRPSTCLSSTELIT